MNSLRIPSDVKNEYPRLLVRTIQKCARLLVCNFRIFVNVALKIEYSWWLVHAIQQYAGFTVVGL